MAPCLRTTHDRLPDFASIGAFGYCTDKFVLTPPGGAEILPCRRLACEDVFCGLMARHAAAHPGADPRAAASLWTLYYFSLLTITPTVCRLVHGRHLPLALDELSVIVNPANALPMAFLLPHAGGEAGKACASADMHLFLRDHLAVLIPCIAKAARLAPKLLWNNAAVYLSWIIGEIETQIDPALARSCRPVIDDPLWPDGNRNPMSGMVVEGNRRVCCLRYMIPTIGGCGASCPLPCGQNRDKPDA
ncbi:siderophore-iron reductase FhuF [Agrobacterium sp. NPDC089420]|uniref:siderophore-iron reductase FhuF n=1 Tax=Agrobacterium sp. NPDC089420 TaxID=3363918 RepID=UPI00385055DB